MNGELHYAHNKLRSRVYWAITYIVIIAAVLFGLYQVAASMQTHTLPAGEIQLSVPYSKYLVGEPITFSIKNNYNSTIYILNDCPNEPLNVYRLVGTVWTRVHDTAAVSECPTQDRMIEVGANGSVDGSFAPWHNLFITPGKYRVVAYVEYYNALPYQEFEVVDKPAAKAPTQTPAVTETVITPNFTQQIQREDNEREGDDD